jgi:cbb3-type cytochrome oxidase subunit 3
MFVGELMCLVVYFLFFRGKKQTEDEEEAIPLSPGTQMAQET